MGAVEKFRMSAKVTECARAARPDCLVTTKSQAFKIHNFSCLLSKNSEKWTWVEVVRGAAIYCIHLFQPAT